MNTPDLFSSRIAHGQSIVSALDRQSKLISRTRLLVFLTGVLWIWVMRSQIEILLLGLIVWLVGFLFLVHKNKKIDKELNIQRHLVMINQEEQKINAGEYAHRMSGDLFLNVFRRTENDLDVYGQGSLFQYIHRSVSDQGHEAFARSMITPYTQHEIILRQQSIQELTPRIDWRQRLMAIQQDHPIRYQTQQLMMEWLKIPKLAAVPRLWQILAITMPVIAIGMTVLHMVGKVDRSIFTSFVLGSFAVLIYFANQAGNWFRHLTRIAKELDTLLPCMKWIEQAEFKSVYLQRLIQGIQKPQAASDSIKTLNKILARYDYRMNPVVFIPLNFLVWWDLQQILALDKWRKKFNGNIDAWFDTLARLEELCSYAQLAYNNPDWVYPEIIEDWFVLETKAVAHPLLSTAKAVVNDFNLNPPNRLALITGSNMAGKSTFLRSIGTNILLASSGSPVHAKVFKISVSKVLTSMRISDNLQEETSTFYAELKKIKSILDAANAQDHVIILIDEMLRGTNGEDRKLGSHGLIKQLIQLGAVAIIASHDTSLSSFKDQYPDQVRNYYFDSYIDGDQLKFDYKIKEGVCSSANASFLMRKMGIDL